MFKIPLVPIGCSPLKLLIGTCGTNDDTQLVTDLERDWDPETQKCIFKNRYQQELLCRCPTSTESTACHDGALETKVGSLGEN